MTSNALAWIAYNFIHELSNEVICSDHIGHPTSGLPRNTPRCIKSLNNPVDRGGSHVEDLRQVTDAGLSEMRSPTIFVLFNESHICHDDIHSGQV